jgi:hypothetical protein
MEPLPIQNEAPVQSQAQQVPAQSVVLTQENIEFYASQKSIFKKLIIITTLVWIACITAGAITSSAEVFLTLGIGTYAACLLFLFVLAIKNMVSGKGAYTLGLFFLYLVSPIIIGFGLCVGTMLIMGTLGSF